MAGKHIFLLPCLDVAKQGEVIDLSLFFPTDKVTFQTPKAPLQFFTAKSVPVLPILANETVL